MGSGVRSVGGLGIRIFNGSLVIQGSLAADEGRAEGIEAHVSHGDQPECGDAHHEGQQLPEADAVGGCDFLPQIEDRKTGVDDPCRNARHRKKLENGEGACEKVVRVIGGAVIGRIHPADHAYQPERNNEPEPVP